MVWRAIQLLMTFAVGTDEIDRIVHADVFTGVAGNYLGGSIVNAGPDPDDRPASYPVRLDFGSGATSRLGVAPGARPGTERRAEVVPTGRWAVEQAAARAAPMEAG